jgi:hypothetical protein
MSQHSLFIVAAEHKAWFDQQAEALGNGGPALVLALSSSGQAPATHGWCAVSLSAEKEAEVQALFNAHPEMDVDWTRYDLSTDPGWPNQRAAELGLQRIQTPFP